MLQNDYYYINAFFFFFVKSRYRVNFK